MLSDILLVGRASSRRFPLRRSNGRAFSDFLPHNGLLNGDFLTELLQGVFSFELLELARRILVQEFVNWQVAAAHSDVDFVLVHSHCHSLRSELVDSLTFPHKHDLQLLSFRVVVNELRESFIDEVVLHGNVDGNSLFQLDDVVLESLYFDLGILQLLQKLQRCLVCLVNIVFEFQDIVRGGL